MKRRRVIENWAEYNKSLVQRGDITLWVSDDAVKNWLSQEHTGKSGRPQVYSKEAILCALAVRSVLHLPLRALTGFLSSLMKKLNILLPVPSFSQISRRAKDLECSVQRWSTKRPTDIVFDATGLKVYGEGEWKVEQHGQGKKRTWMKLHIGMDPDTHTILVAELTTASVGDVAAALTLLPQCPSAERVLGDGAYDAFCFREAIEATGARAVIPPPRHGVMHTGEVSPAFRQRNTALWIIEKLGGDDTARKLWKQFSNYHRRSLVETAFYRFKTIFGERMQSREIGRQRTEAMVKCSILNRFSSLGMPRGSWQAVT